MENIKEDLERALAETSDVSDCETEISEVGVTSSGSATTDVDFDNQFASIEKDEKKLVHFDQKTTHVCHEAGSEVLHMDILQGVTKCLSSGQVRDEAGFPSCFFFSKCLAVGTSHGFVLLFDHGEELKMILGSTVGHSYGAVTALDCPGGAHAPQACADWLLCGYSLGQLILWDIETGKIVKECPSYFHRDAAITCIRFLADGTSAMTVDVKGCVNLIQFKNRFVSYTVDRQVVLNGATGPIYDLAPVFFSGKIPVSTQSPEFVPFKFQLACFATEKRTHIILILPDLKVRVCSIKIPRPASDNTDKKALPYLSWQIQSEAGHGPLYLAIGWGRTVQLVEVSSTCTSTTGKSDESRSLGVPSLDFSLVNEFTVPCLVTGLAWLGAKALAILDNSSDYVVWEPFSQVEIERKSIKHAELVFHCRFSLPEASDDEKILSFHQGYRQFRSRSFFLGNSGLYRIRLLKWDEVIDKLVSENRLLDAVTMCVNFHEGNAKIAVGLGRDPAAALTVTSSKMCELLEKHVSAFLATPPLEDNKLDDIQSLCSLCMDYCLRCSKAVFLMSVIYPMFVAKGFQGMFLETMEPFVLGDRLKSLSPEIMQSFVNHYQKNDMLRSVEQCILHFDITSLDFDQVVKLCLHHRLHSALIFIYCKGFDDYITPLDQLMNVLLKSDVLSLEEEKEKHKDRSDEESDELRNAGLKLLLYLKFCFKGVSFPYGEPLSVARIPSIKREILEYLFEKNIPEYSKLASPHPLVLGPYPRLSILLKFRTRLFLHVLSHLFEGPNFVFCVDKENSEAGVAEILKIIETIMVDPLLIPSLGLDGSSHSSASGTIEDSTISSNWKFTPKEQGKFFHFVGKFYGNLVVNIREYLLLLVFDYLLSPKFTEEDLVLTESILLSILPRALEEQKIDLDRILIFAARKKFFQVTEWIHLRKKNYVEALRNRVDTDSKNAFVLCRDLLSKDSLSDSDKHNIRGVAVEKMPILVEADYEAASKLVINCFPRRHPEVFTVLASSPNLQYLYLKFLIRNRDGSVAEALRAVGVEVTPVQHQRYVELMCEFEPKQVFTYLSTHDNYPLDLCLNVCKSNGIKDAVIYLLERTGDITGALVLMLEEFDSHIKLLHDDYRRNSEEFETELVSSFSPTAPGIGKTYKFSPVELRTFTELKKCVSLCQRNSQKLEEDDNEAIWFYFLDVMVEYLHVKDNAEKNEGSEMNIWDKHIKIAQTYFLHIVLNSMPGFVALPRILEKIVTDHGNQHFGDFRSVIVGMLDSYSYEASILKTVNKLVEDDILLAVTSLASRRSNPVSPRNMICSLCDRAIYSMQNHGGISEGSISTTTPINTGSFEDDLVALFHCGHIFHERCAGKATSCMICAKKETSKPQFSQTVDSLGLPPGGGNMSRRAANYRYTVSFKNSPLQQQELQRVLKDQRLSTMITPGGRNDADDLAELNHYRRSSPLNSRSGSAKKEPLKSKDDVARMKYMIRLKRFHDSISSSSVSHFSGM